MQSNTFQGPRYYIDGRPATILGLNPNGFMTVVYDGRQFKDWFSLTSEYQPDFQPCELSEVELQQERARQQAAKLGIRI